MARSHVGRMSYVLPVVALLVVLFFVGRGTPIGRWPVIIAATLAVILVVVLAEQAGWWPASWRVR